MQANIDKFQLQFGKLLDDLKNGQPVLSTRVQEAADALTRVREDLHTFPGADASLQLAATALGTVARSLASVDVSAYEWGASLLKRLEGTLDDAKALFGHLRAQEPIQRVLTNLQALQAELKARAHETQETIVAPAREAVNKAIDRLNETVEKVKTVPLNQVPVAAAQEALQLARESVALVTDAVCDTPAFHAVQTARETAIESIDKAQAEYQRIRSEMTPEHAAAVAARVAGTGVDRLVTKAAQLDVEFNLTERVKDLDVKYGVLQKAEGVVATATAYAADVDRQYGLLERANSFLETAKGVDAAVTGGKGADLTQRVINAGVDLAEQCGSYMKSLWSQFEGQRSQIKTAGAETAPAPAETPVAVAAKQD